MVSLILAIVGFTAYLLYDINSFTKQYKLLRFGFLAGTLLLAAATLLAAADAWRADAFGGLWDAVFLAIGLLAFAALIYCLFFALPFQETYADQINGRPAYTFGAYAICRHPGVLCFWIMYICIGLAALPSAMIINCVLFSMMNTAYALFQDRVTFPKTFCDYEEYRKKVPFLFPTKASIIRAEQTWGYPQAKENGQ